MRKRFYLLTNPSGHLTCVAAEDYRDGYPMPYERWGYTILLKVNRPLTRARADYVKEWAVRTYPM